jgi:NADH-quinone oxidoreductase subunit G
MQSDEPHLAATARPTVARLSATTAAAHGVTDSVTLTGPDGAITLVAEITDMVDDVVWVPMNSEGCRVYRDLGLGFGDEVRISAGGRA